MPERAGEKALPLVLAGTMQGLGWSRRIGIGLARFSRRKPLGAVGGAIFFSLIVMAIFANLISPYGSLEVIREEQGIPRFHPPSYTYPLGTDYIGRDIRSRIIHGARISLYVGAGAVLVGITGSFLLGIVAAYVGGAFDMVVQRFVDALMSMPGLIIALAIVAVLGSSLNNIILAIVIGLVAPVVRTVRAQVLSLKEMDYVLAARAVGAPPYRIMFRHIMPNCFAIFLVMATYYMGFAIIIEASLSFLGVGVSPDVPSWGGMVTRALQENVREGIWLALFPSIAIFWAVLGFNLLGDALRDVLDPRLRGAK